MLGSACPNVERPPLHEDTLRRALAYEAGFVRDLRVVEETGSTNEDVAALARSGAPEGTVVVAEHQRAGRGRLNREWSCPPRTGLTFSVLLRPVDVPARRWSWLPLLLGCVVCESVSEVTGVEPVLKWPNDVLLDVGRASGPDTGVHQAGTYPQRKICGILSQRAKTPLGPAAAVGVGLNVFARPDELPSPAATSLFLALAGGAGVGGAGVGGAGAGLVDRDRLLRSLLRNLAGRYEAWRRAEGDPVNGLGAAYRARCDTIGRHVRIDVAQAGELVEGRATNVDDNGRLVVATSAGEVAWGAGDVWHVR